MNDMLPAQRPTDHIPEARMRKTNPTRDALLQKSIDLIQPTAAATAAGPPQEAAQASRGRQAAWGISSAG